MTNRNRQVLICILLWAAIAASAAVFWRHPVGLAAVYLAASAAVLAVWRRSRPAWIMYACGFVLGPGGEMVGVHYGAWQYTDAPWLIPIWLPPAWGLAAVVLLELALAIGSESPRR